MSRRVWIAGVGALVVAVGSGNAAVVVSGQSPAAKTAPIKAKGFTTPKTPWGDPDLQGVWTSDDMLSIPMERPDQFAGRAELTDAEFAERSQRDQAALDR